MQKSEQTIPQLKHPMGITRLQVAASHELSQNENTQLNRL